MARPSKAIVLLRIRRLCLGLFVHVCHLRSCLCVSAQDRGSNLLATVPCRDSWTAGCNDTVKVANCPTPALSCHSAIRISVPAAFECDDWSKTPGKRNLWDCLLHLIKWSKEEGAAAGQLRNIDQIGEWQCGCEICTLWALLPSARKKIAKVF